MNDFFVLFKILRYILITVNDGNDNILEHINVALNLRVLKAVFGQLF